VTGFVALLIIGIAFGAGWWLDDFLGNERKIFTVIFMLGSFPITLFAMVRISLWMVGKANKTVERINQEEKDKTAI
jgi:hypothetical protein